MDIIIYEQEQQKKSFYSIMGYYFASLDIKRELESQLYNKDNSTWFLAYEGVELVGFCSIFEEKNKIYFDNFYIIDDFRNKGYGSLLFDAMIKYCREKYTKKIEAIASNEKAVGLFEKYNFECAGNRGKYTKYRLEVL